jgi:hypothetical protein
VLLSTCLPFHERQDGIYKCCRIRSIYRHRSKTLISKLCINCRKSYKYQNFVFLVWEWEHTSSSTRQSRGRTLAHNRTGTSTFRRIQRCSISIFALSSILISRFSKTHKTQKRREICEHHRAKSRDLMVQEKTTHCSRRESLYIMSRKRKKLILKAMLFTYKLSLNPHSAQQSSQVPHHPHLNPGVFHDAAVSI